MIRKTVEWFGGSVVVYVLVAACAGSGVLDDTDEQVAGGGSEAAGDLIDADGDGVPDGMDTDGDGVIDAPMPAGDGDGDMSSIMDPVPEAEAAEDGTRIVNQYRTTAGGLRLATHGFWDTERDEACAFIVTANGERCMPSSGVLAIQSYFSEASCTVALAQHTDDCNSPRYLRGFTSTTEDVCTTSYHYEYYEVGALHTGAVYIGTVDSCIEYVSIPPTTILYTRGARIPNTEFVEGSMQNGG